MGERLIDVLDSIHPYGLFAFTHGLNDASVVGYVDYVLSRIRVLDQDFDLDLIVEIPLSGVTRGK